MKQKKKTTTTTTTTTTTKEHSKQKQPCSVLCFSGLHRCKCLMTGAVRCMILAVIFALCNTQLTVVEAKYFCRVTKSNKATKKKKCNN